MHLITVQCFNRKSIPSPDDTIAEEVNLSFLPPINSVDIYPRKVTGNWIIDIHLKDEKIICFKLPIEMSKEAVLKYCKPLENYLVENE